ncbi:lipid A biosynthesis acyltransferase [Hanstruepera neustonica]|uniref:Lipid A biosynthesis acyltransferase n=1 Tax=Hanstruepera neustonica TaxID=1445657 RepID=A0A2K1DX41_9FLAO|nr:lysophospholipid acyltransferase family protein [Hanstruepera neustonica]PNQ72604.1 lipid A biosynthesis acyltransferase [Hanstruepera neustonica]
MQFLAYILIYPFLWLISLLPFRLLYLFSDFVYVLLFYIIGYRRKTVKENLKLVFPKKSDHELKTISKKFYHHMCDMFLEMIKTLTISRKQLNKRFIIKNPERLQQLEALNKSIVVMYGHYASYEWSFVVENHISMKGIGIYKTIANKYFDKLARKLRSRYNTELIDTKKAIAKITDYESQNVKSVIAFLSDQSPKNFKKYYWTKFMGIKVPCFTGAEKIAKELDLSVTYLKIEKVKRGYYEAEFITLAENAREYPDYEITDKFTRELEKQIRKAPEYYLWTHKRWKHRGKKPN